MFSHFLKIISYLFEAKEFILHEDLVITSFQYWVQKDKTT